MSWVPLTQGTARETQSLIEATIGLSRKTWRASAFLAQGDGDSFTAADPRDRKAVLAEVLALDVWDELLEFARADRRTAEQRLEQLAGETRVLQEQADRKSDVESEALFARGAEVTATEAVAAAEKTLATITEQVRAAEAATARREVAQAHLARVEVDHRRLLQVQVDADRASLDRGAALETTARLTTVDETAALEARQQILREAQAQEQLVVQEYEAAKRELALKMEQRNAILGQASEMNERACALREQSDRLEAAGPGENTCDHCGQTLGVEALAASVLKMRADADELDAGARDRDQQAHTIELPEIGDPPAADPDLHDAIAHTTERLVAARRDQDQRARLQEQVRLLDETIAAGRGPDFIHSLAEAAEAFQEAKTTLADISVPSVNVEGLQADALIARGRVDEARGELTRAQARKTLADEHLRRCVEAEANLAETAKQREQLQQEIDLAADLEKAYGRDGIPALIVESQAIPQIEMDANRILQDLGTPYRVELRTQRELKSGDGLRDTLDVVVITDSGVRAYETFSGGERTRLNLALRIALAKLLAHRRGAESRLLAIDEPDGLDSDGFARLAEVLRGEADTFDRVFVISHHPDLAGAFDTTLEVVKEDGRSRVTA